jgi:molybdate transport system ATP-binding protein
MPDNPPTDPYLDVAFTHRLGTLTLNVAFATSAPWTVLFGPSGSGKSTILRVISGLEDPAHGRVELLDQVVLDTTRRIRVPPHRRAIRWAAQQTTLFPWKSVEENLAFGLESEVAELTPRGVIDEVRRAMDAFQLTSLANRRPHELSGGQQRRVTVARAAIGATGRLLLLDEPFTGLDAEIRDRLVADLRAWLGPTPVVSVTHDVGEAFLLQAEVVCIAAGEVVAQGTVAHVLAQDRKKLLEALG